MSTSGPEPIELTDDERRQRGATVRAPGQPESVLERMEREHPQRIALARAIVQLEAQPSGPARPRRHRAGHEGRLVTADVQREPLVDLLVAHQRRGNGGGCLCGGVRLGESYPEHVSDLVLPLIADAEKRAAARALEPVRAMHVAGSSGFCSGCGWTFPCPTAAALDPSGAAEGAGR